MNGGGGGEGGTLNHLVLLFYKAVYMGRNIFKAEYMRSKII